MWYAFTLIKPHQKTNFVIDIFIAGRKVGPLCQYDLRHLPLGN